MQEEFDIEDVWKILSSFPPRERQIVLLRHGLIENGKYTHPMTFLEIGKIIGLSREMVRLIHEQAICSIREICRKGSDYHSIQPYVKKILFKRKRKKKQPIKQTKEQKAEARRLVEEWAKNLGKKPWREDAKSEIV
jgi:hypothetical protein